MADKLYTLVVNLIKVTSEGKLKWDSGTNGNEYYATVPGSGGFTISKFGGMDSQWRRAPRLSTAPSGQVSSHLSSSERSLVSEDLYELEIRGSDGEVIQAITSDAWIRIQSGTLKPQALRELFEAAKRSTEAIVDRKLDDILDGLNKL